MALKAMKVQSASTASSIFNSTCTKLEVMKYYKLVFVSTSHRYDSVKHKYNCTLV